MRRPLLFAALIVLMGAMIAGVVMVDPVGWFEDSVETTTLADGTQLLNALGVDLSIAEVGCDDIQIWEKPKPGDHQGVGLIEKFGWGFCPGSGINIYVYENSSLRDEAVESAGEGGYYSFAVVMDTVAVLLTGGESEAATTADAVNGQLIEL